MGYWLYIIAGILFIPAAIYGASMQSQVNSTFKSFSKMLTQNKQSAENVAKLILKNAGINDVQVVQISGHLSDNYNPKTKVLSLSNSTYDSTSVAAIGVAAHEAGHAIQHYEGYKPAIIRKKIVPFVNFASRLSLPLLIIGIIVDIFTTVSFFVGGALLNIGEVLIILSVVFYFSSTLFAIITLRVEKDASKRAMSILESSGLLINEELPAARKVLTAAEKTYVASLIISALYFLRFLGRVLMAVSSYKRD